MSATNSDDKSIPSQQRHAPGKPQMMVKMQNLAHILQKTVGLQFFSRAIEISIRLIWPAYLPAGARIHPTTIFGHGGLGVVVNQSAEIGPHCMIGVHVVLGGKAPLAGAPKLEANVTVHSGAVLVGQITIGEGTIIGANAVVTESLPANCVAVGVPARITKTGIDPTKYR